MIEIKNAVFPSPEQFEIVFHGMRNPMKSWDKGDSEIKIVEQIKEIENEKTVYHWIEKCFQLGDKDKQLAKNLINAGPEHAKFLRQLEVIMDIKAPLYWWKQLDTYKIHTTADSESTMHTMTKVPFEIDDFSIDHLSYVEESEDEQFPIFDNDVLMDGEQYLEEHVINTLNALREKYLETNDKSYWYAINELLPQSYTQTRTWSANYPVLFNICAQRAGHKLPEWHGFISTILELTPYFKELYFDKLCQVSEGFRKEFGNE